MPYLGGGFKYFLFSPLIGEDEPIFTDIFQMGGSTTNQLWVFGLPKKISPHFSGFGRLKPL